MLDSTNSSSCDNFWFKGYPSTKPGYMSDQPSAIYPELLHSKSDDRILQNAPSIELEMCRCISDAAIQIQKDACGVYENNVPYRNSKLLSVYYSDGEMNVVSDKSDIEMEELPLLKVTGCFNGTASTSRRTNRYLNSSDRFMDSEHSIKEIISKNDFYKYVLFKQHYKVYLDISQKYEEARTISYYLEEKYHEVKNQRDSLIESNKELEKKIERRHIQLQEKEEELFLQSEKVFRLEEDCKKLRMEKEKIREVKEQLERDKNELYRQLKLCAEESESDRISFEKTRNELMKQFSVIVRENGYLEKKNSELKKAVGDPGELDNSLLKGKNLQKLQQQMTDLKMKAKQSATLNSQLKKGMKHLATCRRRKCSICVYTRATFGEYSNKRRRGCGKLSDGCFPFHEHRKDDQTNPFNLSSLEDSLLEESSKIAKRLSKCSFLTTETYLPSNVTVAHSITTGQASAIPFIDECESANPSDGENDDEKNSITSSSIAGHGFCSDSGFSSELCDSSLSRSKSNSFRRGTKWTTSFRKLIRRVSLRKHD